MRSANEERRRFFRADVIGCAIVHTSGIAARCEIANLSLGGVLLHWQDDKPCPAVSTRLSVELELAASGWITQRGTVRRADPGIVSVVFDPLTQEIEDLIDDEVVAAMEAQRAPRVVVIDGSSSRREEFAAALTEAGCAPLQAATPLEAVRLCERSSTQITGVAVGETATSSQAELVDFMMDTNPGIQVELIPRNPDAGDRRGPALAFGARLRQPTGPISTIGRARRY